MSDERETPLAEDEQVRRELRILNQVFADLDFLLKRETATAS